MKYSGFPRLSWCSFPLHCAALLLSAAPRKGEKGLVSEDGKWRKMIGVGRLGGRKGTGHGNVVVKCENNDVRLFCMSYRAEVFFATVEGKR